MADFKTVENIPTPVDSVIQVLEGVLEHARKGKVTAVAFCVIGEDRRTMNTGFSSTDNPAQLLGAIALLNKRLLDNLEHEE